MGSMVRLVEAVTEATGLKSLSADQPSVRAGKGRETTCADAILIAAADVGQSESDRGGRVEFFYVCDSRAYGYEEDVPRRLETKDWTQRMPLRELQ